MQKLTVMRPTKLAGMQDRIPSGQAASGSDRLFEAVITDHQASPSSFPSQSKDKQHVIRINERL